MRTILLSISMSFAVLIALVLMPMKTTAIASGIAGGVKAPHVNIAIFHKLHGQEGFQFPKNIHAMSILQGLKGKAQFISINHTAGLKDGDVISIASDVLRDDDGTFEDFGVDCQFSVHIKDEDVSIGGMCQIMLVDQSGRVIEHKGFVKPVVMHAGEDWQLIYYNAKDGIAVYADENMEQE